MAIGAPNSKAERRTRRESREAETMRRYMIGVGSLDALIHRVESACDISQAPGVARSVDITYRPTREGDMRLARSIAQGRREITYRVNLSDADVRRIVKHKGMNNDDAVKLAIEAYVTTHLDEFITPGRFWRVKVEVVGRARREHGYSCADG
jgi:hypothetical protein